MVFMGYGILAILSLVGVLPPGLLPYNDTVYGMLGASLFAFYIAHHTKTIVGGKHAEHQMNEKDYVFGASTCINGAGKRGSSLHSHAFHSDPVQRHHQLFHLHTPRRGRR